MAMLRRVGTVNPPKNLELVIQPKVIDHLGIKMYQKPVDVVAEFIANAWDADSEIVIVTIKEDSISVDDCGLGMTFKQCQEFYLTVGRDRRISRAKDVSEEKGRPVLGRKGIGKFAGFGIAKKIEIHTISKENGEVTSFDMDIDSILEYDAANNLNKPIKTIKYQPPNNKQVGKHGTTVILKEVQTSGINIDEFRLELSRRFLLAQLYDDFVVLVNEEELPESFAQEMEYLFPRDFKEEEIAKIPDLEIVDGWGKETLRGHEIKWRIGFHENTIKTEELKGISIFAKGKLAQKPFFFDLTGGISGQQALEYMTGQVIMDFIDEGTNDLIATERQRINLQSELGKRIREWGIERIKFLGSTWKKRRSEKRLEELSDKISGFRERLDILPSREQKTVESVLKKIASFPRLGRKRFQEWCNDVLTSWETGRLRNLISEISDAKDLDEQKLLDLFSEAGILTALNIAESIKTKIVTIGELKNRVDAKQLENKVRDFIYEHPWLIHPKWESFKKERSVKNIIEDIGTKHLKDDAFNGRVDLILSSGESLLLLEFMRPGLKINYDHLDRINYYVIDIRNALAQETGVRFTLDRAYVVADSKIDSTIMTTRINQLESDNILVLTWNSLVEQALVQYIDYLELLKNRFPDDTRIQAL